MADVWVLHPVGLAAVAHLATIVALVAPAVFVLHRKSQRKNPLKKATSARLPPKRVANAAEPPRQEAIIAGNMRNE